MTVYIALDCPHCLTEKAGYVGNAFVPFQTGKQDKYIMLMQCQVCGETIVAKFGGGVNFEAWASNRSATKPSMLQHWPEKQQRKAPDHVPDNVTSFYTQGIDSLARKNFDAAGTMFRKSLEGLCLCFR